MEDDETRSDLLEFICIYLSFFVKSLWSDGFYERISPVGDGGLGIC